MNKNKIVNEGGINGSGEGSVDTKSEALKALKAAIISHGLKSSTDISKKKL